MSWLSVLFSSAIKPVEDSVIRGLQAGLRYENQDWKILAWAEETGNSQAVADCIAIGRQESIDLFDQFGNFLPEVVTAFEALGVGATPKLDPFANTRKLSQDLWAKYAAQAGLATVVVPVAAVTPAPVPVSRSVGLSPGSVSQVTVTVPVPVDTPADTNSDGTPALSPDLQAQHDSSWPNN